MVAESDASNVGIGLVSSFLSAGFLSLPPGGSGPAETGYVRLEALTLAHVNHEASEKHFCFMDLWKVQLLLEARSHFTPCRRI